MRKLRGNRRVFRGTGPLKPFVEATDTWGLSSATARQMAFTDANGEGKTPNVMVNG